jgi:ribonuclease HI
MLQHPPKAYMVKLNFGGATRGNPSLVGIGGVLRNKYKVRLFIFLKFIRMDSNNQAKVVALIIKVPQCVNHRVFRTKRWKRIPRFSYTF